MGRATFQRHPSPPKAMKKRKNERKKEGRTSSLLKSQPHLDK
jgi:hypothetical protein